MLMHIVLWVRLHHFLRLETIARLAGFSAEIFRDEDFLFVPDSTETPRVAHSQYAQKYLERFALTGSLQAKDYADIGVNASYFLALFRAFARHLAACDCYNRERLSA